ncbi:MAG: hypothetical protein AB1422_00440 [bacterium]
MKDICLNGLNNLGRSYGALCYGRTFFSTNRLLLWSKFNKQKIEVWSKTYKQLASYCHVK